MRSLFHTLFSHIVGQAYEPCPSQLGTIFYPHFLSSKRFLCTISLLLVFLIIYLENLRRKGLLSDTLRRYGHMTRGWFTGIMHSRDFHLLILSYGIGFVIGLWYAAATFENPNATFFISTCGVDVTGKIVRISFFAYGNMLGIVTAIFYGIFRLALGRWLSLAGCFFIATSPFHLYVLISSPLRDYPRSLFILAIILLLGFLVKKGDNLVRVNSCSAVIGSLCGFGIQAREEIFTFLGPATMVILFLLPNKTRRPMRFRFYAIMIMFLSFLVFAPTPFVRFHPINITAGFVQPMFDIIGLSRTPYDTGYLSLDEYLEAIYPLTKRADGSAPSGGVILSKSSALLTYIIHYPADYLLRVYSAIQKILSFPFTYQLPPQGIENQLIKGLYFLRSAVQKIFYGREMIALIGVFIILSAFSVRAILLYLGLLLFLSGSYSVQFFGKNFFFFEFFSWWNFLLLIQTVVYLINKKKEKKVKETIWDWIKRPASKRAGLFLAALLILLVLPIIPLRKFQASTLTRLFQKYEQAELEASSTKLVPFDAGRMILPRPPGLNIHSSVLGGAEFLMAEFERGKCDFDTIWPVFRYNPQQYRQPRTDWSRTMQIDLRNSQSSIVKLFFPAWPKFEGIVIPAEQAGCVIGIYRIRNPLQFPLLMTVTLPAERLYKQIEVWEGSGIYATAKPVPPQEQLESMRKNGKQISINEIGFTAKEMDINDKRWLFEGYAIPPVDPNIWVTLDRSRSKLASIWWADVSVGEIDTDLLFTRPRFLDKGSYVIVEGNLYAGGLSIGLVRQGTSAGAVTIMRPGRFTVLLEAQVPGEYVMGIANRLFWYTSLENRFHIDRAIWFNSRNYNRE